MPANGGQEPALLATLPNRDMPSGPDAGLEQILAAYGQGARYNVAKELMIFPQELEAYLGRSHISSKEAGLILLVFMEEERATQGRIDGTVAVYRYLASRLSIGGLARNQAVAVAAGEERTMRRGRFGSIMDRMMNGNEDRGVPGSK